MSFDDDEKTEVAIGDIPPESDDESEYFETVENEPTSSIAVSFKTDPIASAVPISKPNTVAEKIKAAKVDLQFPDEVRTLFLFTTHF